VLIEGLVEIIELNQGNVSYFGVLVVIQRLKILLDQFLEKLHFDGFEEIDFSSLQVFVVDPVSLKQEKK
jgi:hypothetical protein